MFDPGSPRMVGRFISLALVAQPRCSLPNITRFYGSGIHAIYYKGTFPLYTPLSGTETPIYVGQAEPAVKYALTPREQGERLCRRLEDHQKNISKAKSTLDISDFDVIQSGWETVAEDYMIHLFNPVLNNETKILFGLGKHGDSAKTRANRRSPWDVVHPGRAWAADPSLPDAKTIEQITEKVRVHFEIHPVYRDMDSVLTSFIEELRQV